MDVKVEIWCVCAISGWKQGLESYWWWDSWNFGFSRFSLFPEIVEILESKRTKGNVITGRMEVSMCVGCAPTLEDGLWEEGGIIFAIAHKVWARLIVSIKKFFIHRVSSMISETSNVAGSGVEICPTWLGGSGGGGSTCGGRHWQAVFPPLFWLLPDWRPACKGFTWAMYHSSRFCTNWRGRELRRFITNKR